MARWPPGPGWSDDWGDEFRERPFLPNEWREDPEKEEHTVPPEVLRVMQAYGSASWLRVVQVGWNGGRVEPGESRNLFRQKLNEAGFHFVPHNFNNYLRIQQGWDLERVEVTLQRIEKEMRHDRDVLMAAGKLTSREARTGRSRVKIKYPVLEIREDTNGACVAREKDKPMDHEVYWAHNHASVQGGRWPPTAAGRGLRRPGAARYDQHAGYYPEESHPRHGSVAWHR